MSLLIFRVQHWIEKILNEHFGFHPLHADTHILLQTGCYEQFSGQLRRITGIRALTKTIWLSLYKVSVVSLCGTGVAAASLSTVKSRGCTVGESAAYRFIGRLPGSFPLLSCFVLFSGDALTIHCSPVSHFIYLLFRLFVCFSVGGVTWVNPCNVLWCEPVGSRIWKIWSKQMV